MLKSVARVLIYRWINLPGLLAYNVIDMLISLSEHSKKIPSENKSYSLRNSQSEQYFLGKMLHTFQFGTY